MPFTENLNHCMKQRGYSAYRLSQLIGKSNQAALNWQSGKVIPHKETRKKLADLFGITLDELDGDLLPTVGSQITVHLELPDLSKKNSHPAETGRVADKRTQRIFTFVDECSPEELSDLTKYIDFLETRRTAK
jgi:transcriptional regulator with XRE-family HTH domain